MVDDLQNANFERFIFYTVCSLDSNSQVQSVGQEGLRKYPAPDFENNEIIEKLYRLYQGTPEPDSQREASIALKHKILNILAKSKQATKKMPQMVQVSFDSLYGKATSSKLRQSGIAFIQSILRNSDVPTLSPVAPIFLSGLLTLIKDSSLDENIRAFAYEACGILSTRVPTVFETDASLLFDFFAALSTENRLDVN